MFKKFIALVLILVLTLSAFAGCEKTETPTPEASNPQASQSQLVVALNPILSFESGTNTIAFNDVKNAMSNDKKAATLTSLSDNTPWVWVYKTGDD